MGRAARRRDLSSSGMNSLPDLAMGQILQRSLEDMHAGLLPWPRLSLVCRCDSTMVHPHYIDAETNQVKLLRHGFLTRSNWSWASSHPTACLFKRGTSACRCWRAVLHCVVYI